MLFHSIFFRKGTLQGFAVSVYWFKRKKPNLLRRRSFAVVGKIGTFGPPVGGQKIGIATGLAAPSIRDDIRHGVGVSINNAGGHGLFSTNLTMRFIEAGMGMAGKGRKH
jgi:hypothetical protein